MLNAFKKAWIYTIYAEWWIKRLCAIKKVNMKSKWFLNTDTNLLLLFFKNPTFSLWKCTVNFDTKYMKPNFTYSRNKLYKTPFMVYFIKAMSICTVTYEFEIVNLHMFSTWLIKCIMEIDLLFLNLACTSIKPDSFLWSLQHFLWIGQ